MLHELELHEEYLSWPNSQSFIASPYPVHNILARNLALKNLIGLVQVD